jgi:hypothetical protein
MLEGKGDRRVSEKKRIMQLGGVVTLATMIALVATPAMAATWTKAQAQQAQIQEQWRCLHEGGSVDSSTLTHSGGGWAAVTVCSHNGG